MEELKRLARSWRRFWPRADVTTMMIDVGARARAAMISWGLEEVKPLGGGEVALVCGARRAGRPVVLVARLHAVSPRVPVAVTPLGDYCAPWREGLAEDTAALAELDGLLGTSDDEALLHGDLHGGNALEHRGRRVAIDPHAVWGDRHADIWALIDPLSPVLRVDGAAVMAAVSTYAAAANLDPDRAARWARTRAAAEAGLIMRGERPDPAERTWATQLRRFAAALASVA